MARLAFCTEADYNKIAEFYKKGRTPEKAESVSTHSGAGRITEAGK